MQAVLIKLGIVASAVGIYILSTYFPGVSKELGMAAAFTLGLAFPEFGKGSK